MLELALARIKQVSEFLKRNGVFTPEVSMTDVVYLTGVAYSMAGEVAIIRLLDWNC